MIGRNFIVKKIRKKCWTQSKNFAWKFSTVTVEKTL